MNETLSSLLQQLQDGAKEVGTLAADAAYALGKQVEKLSVCAKHKMQAAELRSDINLRLRELGELLYATHTGNPTDSEVLLAKMQEIDELKAALATLEKEDTAQEDAVCPYCGSPIKSGDQFCRDCGGAL